MSFIYNLADTWNNAANTYYSILMNASNGAGGSAVGSSSSRLISLQNNGSEVFGVDILGNIISSTGNLLNNVTNVTNTATISNSYNGSSVYFSGAAFYTATFNAVGTYTDGFKVFLYNGDTRAKIVAIPGIPNQYLWPQGMMTVGVKGGAFFYTKPPRYALPSNTTFYLDAALGNDANDGLATGAGAYQTMQAFYNRTLSDIDCRGNQLTSQFADGTYTGGMHASGPFVGQQGHAGWFVSGNNANPQNVVVQGLWNQFDRTWTRMQGLKIDGIGVQSNSTIRISGNVILNSTDWQFILTDASSVILEGNGVNIDVANCNGWVLSDDQSIFQGSNRTINFAQATAFATAGVFCQYEGTAYFRSCTFSGVGCTGTRYQGYDDGRIGTGGGGANFLPGNAPGAVANGATYN